MYKIALCDDNLNELENIKNTFMNFLPNSTFFEYTNGTALLNDVDQNHHLIFIDIQLPDINGNQVAIKLREKNKTAILVLYSGIYDPTVDSFKSQPFRYIKKGMDEDELNEDIGDILVKLRHDFGREKIIVKNNSAMIVLVINDILYIEKRKHGSSIKLLDESGVFESITAKGTRVNELYNILKELNFEYSHNSFLVNLEKVSTLKGMTVNFTDGISVPISKAKKKTIQDRFFSLWKNN